MAGDNAPRRFDLGKRHLHWQTVLGEPSLLNGGGGIIIQAIMTDPGPASGSRGERIGASLDIKPDAYDPATSPELFEGVLARRVIAFIIDIIVIVIPLIVGWMFIFVFGLVTFGLGWALFWLMSPGSVLWALVYYGITLGSPASATLGMRAMDIEMRTWYGAPAYFVLGAVHAIVFWISISVLTPFILVVGLLNIRHRLLHDMLVGTVLINNAARTAALRVGSRP
jgi:uncharacterized RDD family membrane protein YckC